MTSELPDRQARIGPFFQLLASTTNQVGTQRDVACQNQMPPLDRPKQYAQAILNHVETGAYPNSEDVVSAELPPEALPNALQLIKQTREDLEVGQSGLYASSYGAHTDR